MVTTLQVYTAIQHYISDFLAATKESAATAYTCPAIKRAQVLHLPDPRTQNSENLLALPSTDDAAHTEVYGHHETPSPRLNHNLT